MSAYLNSCLKVPVDPCNNRPTPVFSRPKMYFGCLSTTPNNATTTAIPRNCNESRTESKCTSDGISSLVKLYESIPDYRDINHLSGEEFYSTLNTFRSTCQELKFKTSCLSSDDRCSVTTSSTSVTSSSSQLPAGRSGKKVKKSKKKESTQNRNFKNNSDSQISKSEQTDCEPSIVKAKEHDNLNEPAGAKAANTSFFKSSKRDLDKEIEHVKKEFEVEFKRPLSSLNCNEYLSIPQSPSNGNVIETQYANKKLNEKIPVRKTYSSTLPERLRKALSFNDLHSVTEPPEPVELKKQNKSLQLLSLKEKSNTVKGRPKLSNYFQEKSPPKDSDFPKIVVDLPSTEQSCTDRVQAKKNNAQKYNKNGEYKMPFELFNLGPCKKEGINKHSTPSPVHPVARPNLAATLRAESSKKKVKELNNSCTPHNSTTQFDWEVRKTPAWKTLSLNESHKEILQLRLATRKAEQALQQREYELNMELMRQRVKSAPLLLEGPLYWRPRAHALSDPCQKEGRRHMCQSNQLRTKRRKNSSRSHNCRRRMLLNTFSDLQEENCDDCRNTFRAQTELSTGIAHKTNTLRKIYGSECSGTKSQSRSSNRSTNNQLSLKFQRKKNANTQQKNKQKPCKDDTNFVSEEVDSGEELSSLDRAFL